MSTESVKHADSAVEIPLQSSGGNQQPIFIALIILGIIGLTVSAIGFTSLGAHQNWWSAGSLSHLSQMGAILMTIGGAGGCGVAQLILSITGLVNAHPNDSVTHAPADVSILDTQKDVSPPIEDPLLMELDKLLTPGTYTLVPQEGNTAEVVFKQHQDAPSGSSIRRGTQKLNLETSADAYDTLKKFKGAGYKFIKTYEITGINLNAFQSKG